MRTIERDAVGQFVLANFLCLTDVPDPLAYRNEQFRGRTRSPLAGGFWGAGWLLGRHDGNTRDWLLLLPLAAYPLAGILMSGLEARSTTSTAFRC